jgi:hypothetical protein
MYDVGAAFGVGGVSAAREDAVGADCAAHTAVDAPSGVVGEGVDVADADEVHRLTGAVTAAYWAAVTAAY